MSRPRITPNMTRGRVREYINGDYPDEESIHIAAAMICVELAGRLCERCPPIVSGDAVGPDLKEAAFSILQALKNRHVPPTDVELLMLELAMSVRRFAPKRRNERKDPRKFIEAMLRDAEWIAAHDEPMSENKLADESKMPRRTIGRWRKHPEWQARMPTLIKAERMLLEIRSR